MSSNKEAISALRRALAGRNKTLGENHPRSRLAKWRVENLEKE